MLYIPHCHIKYIIWNKCWSKYIYHNEINVPSRHMMPRHLATVINDLFSLPALLSRLFPQQNIHRPMFKCLSSILPLEWASKISNFRSSPPFQQNIRNLSKLDFFIFKTSLNRISPDLAHKNRQLFLPASVNHFLRKKKRHDDQIWIFGWNSRKVKKEFACPPGQHSWHTGLGSSDQWRGSWICGNISQHQQRWYLARPVRPAVV